MKLRGSAAQGFTLVELMTVVTIVGIMATIGVSVLTRHTKTARASEGLAMVQSIRAAEERWAAENTTYSDVSTAGWFPRDPTGVGDRKVSFMVAEGAHADAAAWLLLNPVTGGAVYGGYQCNAGLADEPMTELSAAAGAPAWPTPTEPWYVIQAIMDVDADGDEAEDRAAIFAASSLNGEVFQRYAGE